MNWDEKAYLEDNRRREIGSGFPCLTDELFTDGAQWQRDQMRTNEPVERMAKALYEQSSAYKWHGAKWYDLPEDQREGIRKSAKIGVDALLGED